jgi:hypothetical protein
LFVACCAGDAYKKNGRWPYSNPLFWQVVKSYLGWATGEEVDLQNGSAEGEAITVNITELAFVASVVSMTQRLTIDTAHG